MKGAIIQTGPDHFELSIRGAHMTLRRISKNWGEWEMTTDNASARAWAPRGLVMPKYFASLAEIESHYKSWRGIAALVETPFPEAK